MIPGEHILVSDSEGRIYTGEITSVEPQSVDADGNFRYTATVQQFPGPPTWFGHYYAQGTLTEPPTNDTPAPRPPIILHDVSDWLTTIARQDADRETIVGCGHCPWTGAAGKFPPHLLTCPYPGVDELLKARKEQP